MVLIPVNFRVEIKPLGVGGQHHLLTNLRFVDCKFEFQHLPNRSGGNLPGIWLLNEEDLVITGVSVRANGVTKDNAFYYCTDNYFQPVLDLLKQ